MMQLVGEGKVDLDRPIRDYLPDLKPEHGMHEVVAFSEPVDGRATYLFRGGRLSPRGD
ncbi:beta-lactamase family protein [Kribbella soli]